MDEFTIEDYIEFHEKEAVKADNLYTILRIETFAGIAANHRRRAQEYRALL